ncbi:MAG: GTP pyrophosphokinase [Candidatus Binatia bacterium]|nr:GTP pyrophosphokinase [Candidatus Binatia bacterium]
MNNRESAGAAAARRSRRHATLEDAIELAVRAHRGATDKAGAPYILHVLRVMLAVEGDVARMAAALHDVVEDTSYTPDDLRRLGFPVEVVDAVDALTRRPGELYEDFVRRAAAHPIARQIKLADLEDNMDIRRLPHLREADLERLARYRAAWEILASAKPADHSSPAPASLSSPPRQRGKRIRQ